VLHGIQSLRAGSYSLAEEQFRQALSMDAENPQAAYYLAVAQQKRGALNEAAASFRRALADSPQGGFLHAQLGLTLAVLRDPSAGGHLERALELAKDDTEARLTVARGFLALEAWSKAEGTLLDAEQQDSSHPEILAELFQLYVLLGNYEAARPYAQRAAAANPADARVQYRVGMFWAGEGEVARAREALTRAAALEPQNQKIRALLERVSAQP
jgi:Tfp pilus assembly protein PilF